MKIITDFEQLSEEWFAFKLSKFGASDAQAIANNGAGLTTLVYEKVAERLTGKAKEGYSNEAMLDGINRENEARNLYELERDVHCQTVGLIELDEFTVASPDGLIGEDGLIEIKNPIAANYVKYLYKGEIDSKYVWQTQMQLFVSGRKWVDFVVCHTDFPKPITITRIERDTEKIAKIEAGLIAGQKMIQEILKKI